MALTHEWMFYEVMWRLWTAGVPYPTPWWVQEQLSHWSDDFDGGLFDSKESAFASNALYRYWSMVGVADHLEESLVGPAGEIEPVYDQYAMCFFMLDRSVVAPRLYLPQSPDPGRSPTLRQELD